MRTAMIAFAALIFLMGCTEKTMHRQGGAAGDDVVALVGGEHITVNDLDEATRDQLQRIAMKVHQIKKRALDTLIEQKLIAAAAQRKGVSVERYIADEIEALVTEPAQEEIQEVFEMRKGRGGASLEAMRDQIVGFLKQQQRMKARNDLLDRLRTEYAVKTLLKPPRIQVSTDGAPSTGPGGAPITIVEFSDYECPFSKRVRDTVWSLVDTYKDAVRYVYRDFPLSFHRRAKKAHEAAHCAGDQDAYFAYNRLLFDNQKRISIGDLKSYAKKLDLDVEEFNACLDEGEHADDVKRSIAEGTAAGVSGTPAFFINGIMLSGAQPKDAFVEIIDAELARQATN